MSHELFNGHLVLILSFESHASLLSLEALDLDFLVDVATGRPLDSGGHGPHTLLSCEFLL